MVISLMAAVLLAGITISCGNDDSRKQSLDAHSAFSEPWSSFMEQRNNMDDFFVVLADSANLVGPQMTFSGVGARMEPNILAMEAAAAQMALKAQDISDDFKPVADKAVANAQATVAAYRRIITAGETGDMATINQCSADIESLRKENRELIDQDISYLESLKQD